MAKRGYKRHGGRKTRLYTIWTDMKSRCRNKNNNRYYCYGGRGIKVCEEWKHDFQAFRDWAMANGYRDDLTLDRMDFNGNYEPSNCKWSDCFEQMNNRRTNNRIEYKGEVKTLTQWSRELGINRTTILQRFKYGWSVEEALSTPVRGAK